MIPDFQTEAGRPLPVREQGLRLVEDPAGPQPSSVAADTNVGGRESACEPPHSSRRNNQHPCDQRHCSKLCNCPPAARHNSGAATPSDDSRQPAVPAYSGDGATDATARWSAECEGVPARDLLKCVF